MIERFFIEQGMKKIELENYMRGQLDKAGFTGLNIVKTPLVTRIVLNVTRPGLAIGKGGQNIKQLTRDIEEKFGFNNPQIEIQEIQNQSLNAAAVAAKISNLLERGYSWRSVSFRTITDMQKAGAQGIELILSGKLAGKGGRKRKQRIAVGYMKKVGHQIKLVDFAKLTAYPKPGAIGIKLRIIRPGTVFPDKIDFAEILRKKETVENEKVQAQETLAEAEEVKAKPIAENAVEQLPVVEQKGVEEKKPGEKAAKKDSEKSKKQEKEEKTAAESAKREKKKGEKQEGKNED